MRKVLLYGGILAAAFCLGIFFDIQYTPLNRKSSDSPSQQQLRLHSYRFTNPLLACDIVQETKSPQLKKIRSTIDHIVEDSSSREDVKRVSIYFRDLTTGEWTGVNENDLYAPASLLKIPVLIAYLKEGSINPTTLDKKIVYMGGPDLNEKETFAPANSLEKGISYSISELMSRMIVSSGNNSLALLLGAIGQEKINEVFLDVGLKQLEFENPGNILSPKQYSIFLRILFNGSYLSPANSEKALELLTHTTFKEGLLKNLPDSLAIAHKFGERSGRLPDGTIFTRQLHDCGIVYKPNKPYLLCVMTEGDDFDKLSVVIGNISRAVFDQM